jgi:hypothetical protein
VSQVELDTITFRDVILQSKHTQLHSVFVHVTNLTPGSANPRHRCGDGPHKTMPKLFEHLGRCKAPPKGEKL